MDVYDVAVVGSGLIGVASAYELARAGCRVALIDQGGLGKGSSSANTGLLLFEGSKDSMMFSLCEKGIQLYTSLGKELGIDIGFSPIEMLSYFCREEEIPQGEAQMQLYRESGFPCDLLDAAQVHREEPGLCMDGILGGLLFRQWKMDPLKVIYGYFLGARALGMDWYPEHQVIGFQYNGTEIQSVQTSQGSICAKQFLIATGAWTRSLMATLNIDIPEYYIQGAALVAERGGIGPNHVVCHFEPKRVQAERRSSVLAQEKGWGNFPRQDACEFIILKDAHDNIVSAQRSMVQKEIVTRVPPDFVRDMCQNVCTLFPQLKKCQVIRSWISPVPFVPDEKPFFGFVKPYHNLFLASGFASVLIMAPIIGQLVTDLLLGKTIPYDFSGFEPRRFEGGAV